jgi:hypothetical protein
MVGGIRWREIKNNGLHFEAEGSTINQNDGCSGQFRPVEMPAAGGYHRSAFTVVAKAV